MARNLRKVRVLLACAFLFAGTVLSASCDGEGKVEQELIVLLYGPTGNGPDGKSLEEKDAFKDCDFLKICYRFVGQAKPRDCQVVEFGRTEMDFNTLPVGKDVSVLVQCLQADKNSSPPQPSDTVKSQGQTCPVRHDSGEGEEADMNIYLLQSGQFGPTFEPPPPEGGEGKPTFPNEEHWGGTLFELFDGNVLIAGGATQLTTDCKDWSDPACLNKVSAKAELYDPRNGSFTPVGEGSMVMIRKRAFAAAVELPSAEIAIFGGVTDGGKITDTVEIYDPFTRTFRDGPPMGSARAYHTATLISNAATGFVLIVGGFGAGEKTWEVWAPEDGSMKEGSLTHSRWNHTATRVNPADAAGARNMVVIAGGEGGGSPGSTVVRDSVEIFDIENETMDQYPLPLCSNDGKKPAKKTLHDAALVAKRHFLYIVGGFDDGKHSNPQRDICVFNTGKEQWDAEKGKFLMKLGRGGLTATTLPGNLVLLAGGITRTKETSPLTVASTVEIILEFPDESGSTKIEVGPQEGFAIAMMYPRWGHEAVMTCDGKVLFIGGLAGSPGSPSIVEYSELFNQM